MANTDDIWSTVWKVVVPVGSVLHASCIWAWPGSNHRKTAQRFALFSLRCPAVPCQSVASPSPTRRPFGHLPSRSPTRIQSMGSSSNTNSSGGGSDKEDKGKRKNSSEPSFKEGDRVLAYHGPLLYEAKVQRIENLDGERRYFVHYLLG
ncbi:hypothetical protein U9M48_024750 [Paspalum notatum var. saurae]|uniref:Uncharacterized protein n=1 Tax=Paspalum notatum var. saurae TaxID=547442 RepID=A0AAQ3TPF4_PASNO